MISLFFAFLKIFSRNLRALFFILVLPLVMYVGISYLGIGNIIRLGTSSVYQEYLLSGIVAMSLMQLGIFSTGYALIDFRRSGILKRIAVSPLSAASFLVAHGLARTVLALAQTGLLLFCGFIFFGLTYGWLVILVPLLVAAGLVLFLNLGYLIASLAKDYEDAAPATTAINLLLIFLGDVFFPSAALPRPLAILADILPMKAFSNLFRLALSGTGHVLVWQVLVLAAWLVITSIVSFWIFAKKAYR